MQGVRLALYAKLLDLKTVRIIATVLLCNVVAVFALFACQCDLGTDVAGLAHCFLTSLKHNLMCWFIFELVPRSTFLLPSYSYCA